MNFQTFHTPIHAGQKLYGDLWLKFVHDELRNDQNENGSFFWIPPLRSPELCVNTTWRINIQNQKTSWQCTGYGEELRGEASNNTHPYKYRCTNKYIRSIVISCSVYVYRRLVTPSVSLSRVCSIYTIQMYATPIPIPPVQRDMCRICEFTYLHV